MVICLFAIIISLWLYLRLYRFSYKNRRRILFKNYYLKQIFWIVLSFILFFLIIRLSDITIDSFIIPLYFFTMSLLLLILFMPSIRGSHRWISLGFINFQPSELAKLSLVLMLAKSLGEQELTKIKVFIRATLILIPYFVLLILEPDLGTSIIFLVIYFSMLILAGININLIVILVSPLLSVITSFFWPIFIVYLLLLIIYLLKTRLNWTIVSLTSIFNIFSFFITPILWGSLKTYQQKRIITFLDPSRDPLGSGYQIIQSKIAIGSGSFFGKGFLMGSQKNLNFLPEHHTDFIISVIGEEFGFVGLLVLSIIFYFFFRKILNIAVNSSSKVKKLAILGILSFLFFQFFVNVGMNIGLLPITGISLPFVSYGGSSILVCVMSIAYIIRKE